MDPAARKTKHFCIGERAMKRVTDSMICVHQSLD